MQIDQVERALADLFGAVEEPQQVGFTLAHCKVFTAYAWPKQRMDLLTVPQELLDVALGLTEGSGHFGRWNAV